MPWSEPAQPTAAAPRYSLPMSTPSTPAGDSESTPQTGVPLAALEQLMRSGPVFDAHADSIGLACDLGVDLAGESPGHLDLVRGQRGGLGAWVVVCWVDPELWGGRARERAHAMMDAAFDLARRRPGRFSVVGNGAQLARAQRDGRVAGILGIEGGHAIEGSLEILSEFIDRGLRVMTLVWNNHLPWVRSCQGGAGPGVPAGLSRFGREVVRTMNRAGVVVDLSHAGERSFFDALEISDQPVLASHSGCFALHGHPRNLKDDQLRALGQKGGVCGIVFHPGFLSARAREEQARVRASPAWARIGGSDPATIFLEQQRHMRRAMRPFPLDGVVDHIAHAVEIAGIEHVGLGSDFDGIECGPAGLEDAGCYGALARRMAQRGFALDEIAAVLGGNLRRVFAQCTAEAPDIVPVG